MANNVLFANPEAEAALIGTVLADHRAWAEAQYLQPEQFNHYRAVWQILCQRGGQVTIDGLVNDLAAMAASDGTSVLERLGGRPAIHALFQAARASDQVPQLAQVIMDTAANRQLHQLSGYIRSLFQPSETQMSAADRVEAVQQRLSRITTSHTTKGTDMYQAITEAWQEVMFYADNPGKIPGLRLGWRDLDEGVLCGLQPGNLLMVASNTGEGKSIFVGEAFRRLATIPQDDGRPRKVALFGVEMSGKEVVGRMMTARAKVSSDDIRASRLTKEQLRSLEQAREWLKSELAPNFVYRGPADFSSIRDIVHQSTYLVRQEGVEAIAVDYIQRVTPTRNRENRTDEIGEVTSRLKQLAGELNVPVIAVSQVDRNVAKHGDGRPRLHDMAESSSLEKDSDYVLTLWVPGYHLANRPNINKHWLNVAILTLVKGRFRKVSDCYLLIKGEFALYENLDSDTVKKLRTPERQADLDGKERVTTEKKKKEG